MAPPVRRLYEFGPYRLDPVQKLLFRGEKPVPLSIKSLEVLLVLAENAGQVVEKQQVMAAAWPDTFVEEGNLTFQVHVLRKALNDLNGESKYIETIPKRGYRLVALVREVEVPRRSIQHVLPAPAEMVPEGNSAQEQANLRRYRFWIAGFAVVIVSLLAVLYELRGAHKSSAVSATPLTVTPFTSFPGSVQSPAFSPDGERIAFAWTGPPGHGNWSIYVKLIGSGPPLRITTDSGLDSSPAWSPDGRQIAFLRERKEEKTVGIYLVGAFGGEERKLLDVNYGRYFDLAWSSDGRYIAYAEKTNPALPYDDLNTYVIKILTVSSSEKRQLTFPSLGTSDQRFAFSPDGKTLAFLRLGYESGVGIFLVPAGGGDAKNIYTEHAWAGHLAWSEDGHSLIFTSDREGGSKLWKIPATGGVPEPLPLAEELAYYPAVAPRGDRFAYIREYADSDLYRVELTNGGGAGNPPVPFLATARIETSPAFSPDGKKIAFLSDRSGKRELWLADSDGSNAVALTDYYAWATTAPSWSPDSKNLVFYAGHGPGGAMGGLFILDLSNKSIRRLSQGDGLISPQWSRDGSWIYVAESTSRDGQLWKIPASGGARIQITHGGGALPKESPDGDYIYYLKWPTGIWRVPAGGGEETEVIAGFDSRLLGHWQVMKEGVFFVDDQTNPYATLKFYNFSNHKARAIAMLNGAPTMFNGGLTVSPDRKAIVYSQDTRAATDIMLVEHFH